MVAEIGAVHPHRLQCRDRAVAPVMIEEEHAIVRHRWPDDLPEPAVLRSGQHLHGAAGCRHQDDVVVPVVGPAPAACGFAGASDEDERLPVTRPDWIQILARFLREALRLRAPGRQPPEMSAVGFVPGCKRDPFPVGRPGWRQLQHEAARVQERRRAAFFRRPEPSERLEQRGRTIRRRRRPAREPGRHRTGRKPPRESSGLRDRATHAGPERNRLDAAALDRQPADLAALRDDDRTAVARPGVGRQEVHRVWKAVRQIHLDRIHQDPLFSRLKISCPQRVARAEAMSLECHGAVGNAPRERQPAAIWGNRRSDRAAVRVAAPLRSERLAMSDVFGLESAQVHAANLHAAAQEIVPAGVISGAHRVVVVQRGSVRRD